MYVTKVTKKYQTTIPAIIRKILGIKSGSEVEWQIRDKYVVVTAPKKVENPVSFLCSQIKMREDAVKLVKKTRKEIG